MADMIGIERRQQMPGPHFRYRRLQVSLQITRGIANHLWRPVHGPVFMVGTSRDCDLVLADPNFPDFHFYLYIHGAAIVLRHLGAEPDVTVNGVVVDSLLLHDGDRIRTGPFEFYLHLGQRRSWTLPASPPDCRAYWQVT